MKQPTDPFAWSMLDTPAEAKTRLDKYRSEFAGLLTPEGQVKAAGISYMLRTAAGDGPALDTLIKLADSSTAELLRLAEADPWALVSLLEILKRRIVELQDIDGSVLKVIARRADAWPQMIYREAKHRQWVEKYVLDDLRLGEEFHRKLKGKTGEGIFHLVAKRLHDQLISFRRGGWSGAIPDAARKLKPFTARTARKWWTVAKKQFAEDYGKEFENHRAFKQWIGLHKQTIDGETEAGIRAIIKREIRDRFLALAP